MFPAPRPAAIAIRAYAETTEEDMPLDITATLSREYYPVASGASADTKNT